MMDFPVGVITLTALIPTKGHKALVKFARQYLANLTTVGSRRPALVILIFTRSFEPISGQDRFEAFYNEFCVDGINNECYISVKYVIDDNAPQNPPDPPASPDEFWKWWKDTIHSHVPSLSLTKQRYLFSSELYGNDLARVLEAQHVPFDAKREYMKTKGSKVRGNIRKEFSNVMYSFQSYLKKKVTIFGAESCGKTTVANAVAENVNGLYVPEWARQYLETVGPELNLEKMTTIANGQYSIQQNAWVIPDFPVVIQDTDLLSTIGYYRVGGWQVPELLVDRFADTQSDLYILMKSNIPFEPDPLRYGIDKRETDDKFWIKLLEEFHCKYVIIDDTTKNNRIDAATYQVHKLLNDFYAPIESFIRE